MEKVSIIVPVYNHEKIIKNNIHKIITEMDKFDFLTYEIILINDGSKDSSFYEMEQLTNDHLLKINKPNNGLGSVLQIGFKQAKGDFIICLDLDLSYDIQNIKHIIEYLKEYDCVVCSKYKLETNYYPFIRKFFSSLYYYFFGIFSNINVRDIGSGLLGIRSNCIRNASFISNGFGIHYEIFMFLHKINAKMIEIPVNYKHMPGSFCISNHGITTFIETIKVIKHFKKI
jgi:glycosyltransferase involved in cell wall biosynthesis